MSAVFLKVLNMSITAGWLIGAVFFARLILRRAPKWIFCLLWGLVALRLVIPFSLESVLSLIPSAGTVPADIAVSPRPALDSGINFVDQAVNPVIMDSFSPAPANSVNPLQVVVEAASAVWIAGIAVMLLWALVSYLRLRRKVAASVENGEGTLICDEIDSPFILGIVRPKIYVPSGLAGSSLDCVVRHERAHIARRDHWWKPLGFLILSVYWFNPLCWIAYALLCRDIEGACDEKVIRDLDKAEVSAYSEALLECGVKRRFVSVCPLAFGEVGVKERIKSVLSYKKPAFWIILVALVLCVVLAVCLMTDPRNKAFSIKYDLGKTASHFTLTPSEAKAGEEVELRTDILIDADIHVYVDGREIDKSHYDSDYWGYSFFMPDKDVSVTARFYTKGEIWGSGDLELNALKEKYPGYFGLDASKGLEVYVWQMAPGAYWFGLASRTDGEMTFEEMLKLKGASAEEMRAILSTYGLDEDMISVIPWQNPVSSYLPEYWIVIQGEDPASVQKRRQEYVDKVRRFLFDGVPIPQDPAATVPASNIEAIFDNVDEPYRSSNYREISPEEFGGVSFFSDTYEVFAETPDGKKETLFGGMPIHNVYFYDLNGDGKREICSTVSIGSGMIDNRVVVYDYANRRTYDLSDRGKYDYIMYAGVDELFVEKRDYFSNKVVGFGTLALTDGKLTFIGSQQDPEAEKAADISSLKRYYPEYFGLSAAKGLEVLVWENTPGDHSCVLLSLENDRPGENVYRQMMGVSVEQMKLILSTYGVPGESIRVTPIRRPLPRYYREFDGEYRKNLRDLILEDRFGAVSGQDDVKQYDMLPAPSSEQIRENSQVVQQFRQNKTGMDIPEKVEVTLVAEKSFEQLSSECEKIAGLIERERWCEAISRNEATEKAYNETGALWYYDNAAMDKHLQAGEVIGASAPLINAGSADIAVSWQFAEYSPRLSQFCDKTDFDPGTAADEDFAYAARCFLKKYLPEYLPEADAETTVEREDGQYACVRIGGVSFEFSWRENDLQKLSGEKAALFRFDIYDPQLQTAECEVLKIETAFENACAKYGYDAKNTVVYDVDFKMNDGVPFYEFLCSSKSALATFIIATPAISVTHVHDHYVLG